MRVCVCACVRACVLPTGVFVRLCVCACVRACMHACVCVTNFEFIPSVVNTMNYVRLYGAVTDRDRHLQWSVDVVLIVNVSTEAWM